MGREGDGTDPAQRRQGLVPHPGVCSWALTAGGGLNFSPGDPETQLRPHSLQAIPSSIKWGLLLQLQRGCDTKKSQLTGGGS